MQRRLGWDEQETGVIVKAGRCILEKERISTGRKKKKKNSEWMVQGRSGGKRLVL